MPNKDLINSVLDPKIPLKELWAADNTEVTENNIFMKQSGGKRSSADSVGSDRPFVKINNVPVTDIDTLIIDETGNIPKIKIIFEDGSGALSGPNYPKNNPILSVYIKTQSEKFKPIRCDFLITDIKTNNDPSNGANVDLGSTFIMTGELFIPKIYDDSSKSYPAMTSKDVLLKLAEDLELGFEQNEFTPSDQMTWLNTNNNGLYFMNQVGKHAYLDDKSFFNVFINKYYHINLINVAEQLNPSHDLTYTYDNTVDASQLNISQEADDKDDSSIEDNEIPIMLTNRYTNKGRPEYIINYSLMGINGRILKRKGFKKQIYYYDHILDGEEKFTSFYVNSIKVEGYNANEGSNEQLVPIDESLKNSIIKKWMNIDYGNAHNEWNASALINDHNISELNKVKLKVETNGINFQVVRGMGVPVIIYQDSSNSSRRNAYRSDKEEVDDLPPIDTESLVPDDILSGRYYVIGARYIYDKYNKEFPFKTELQLGRINWIGENNIVTDA